MEIAPGIHRIESSLGVRFMAQYVLAGDARTLLVDTGMSDTPAEALGPYLESVGLGLQSIDEVIISHADLDHSGGNRSLRELHPGSESRATSSTGAGSSRTRRWWPRTTCGTWSSASSSRTRPLVPS